MGKKILVAVAWPYASGARHLGHVAGFGVPSDVFARYQRLAGSDVLMVSGTDDHGTPITVRAEKENKTPKELTNFYNAEIRRNLRDLGLSYDLFTRTSTENHYAVTQDFFKRLLANGYIFQQEMIGTYSEADKRFLPDRYVEGTCPHCGYDKARGDQCDNCGKQLDPTDLINPRSTLSGATPVFKPTTHFFLNLPAFAERLREWIGGQSHWRPNVRRFSLGLLEELPARAITRDLSWGIPIPVEGEWDDKRIYVWFDAVIGYLSAAIEWADKVGRPEAWREWWQNPESRHYYFMGKDNIVFHSVIWPAMLLGRGELDLPYEVVSSEFLTLAGGEKISSSRAEGHEIPLVGDFLAQYDPDPLRYFLVVAGPETSDSEWSLGEFIRRNNEELVATWGNLVNRVLSIAHKNFGQVPQPGALTAEDEAVLATVRAAFARVGGELDTAHFKAALNAAMGAARSVNEYLASQEPWKVLKVDRERGGTILYVALQAINNLRTLFTPFLPFTSQKLHELLGHAGDLAGPIVFEERSEPNGSTHEVLTCYPETWVGRWEWQDLPAGQALHAPTVLFRKLELPTE
ncbi:MAG TPA: methionine--tRNA ligase [Herpetosiphonaceae bacterium]|nr:methionine--tRNA ligase [Herpetosiphonaceae bacterium]